MPKYKVILEGCDSRIFEVADDYEPKGETIVDTWEEAKEKVCNYLLEEAGRNIQALRHFNDCKTFEDHNGAPAATVWPPPQMHFDTIGQVMEWLYPKDPAEPENEKEVDGDEENKG